MQEIDITLIKKYDKPGPRYTSYPTAPHFKENFNRDRYVEEVVRISKENKTGLSLYFHLPFCDTLCYFCGCNMIVTHNRGRIREYIKYVKKEIELIEPYLDKSRKVEQLHWGGGTPSYLNPDEIEDLAGFIREKFCFSDDAEISCEVDPRGLTYEHLKALRESGFNRVSMGVQDFNPVVQQAVNRIQSEELVRECIGYVRELGFHSINLDLIYGLPHQNLNSFSETLDKIIDISPDRIAVFNYAHVPWLKKHMSLINENDLPSPEEKLFILKHTIERLSSAGYTFIGMDHFSKPEDELSIALKEKKLYRNFQGYSTRAGLDMLAFGITAIGQTDRVYVQNYKTEKEYFEAIDSGVLPVSKGYILNEDDMLRKDVIMRLMCDFGLNIKSIENKYSINFNEYFPDALIGLQPMIEDGLVEVTEENIIVTEKGRLLIRNIAMNFDAYIQRREETAKYSRTV